MNVKGQYGIVPYYPSVASVGEGDLVFWADTYKPGLSHVGLFHTPEGSSTQAAKWIAAQHGMVGLYSNTNYWRDRFYGYGSVFLH